MVKANILGGALIAAGLTAMPAGAQSSHSISLSLNVPVHCQVRHDSAGYGGGMGNSVALGALNEFCNAPRGYTLVVTYDPGTLRGAVIQAGDDRVVLDGSGQATLARANGPQIRSRPLIATPGENGFDSDNLGFQIQPA